MSTLSDPYGELPLRNDKYAALCSELHLSKRNIHILAHFGAFTQLSTLWLNQNKLKKLEGLDKNVRLRNLHVHGNRITKLKGSSLAFFKFLEYLTLNDNMLDSIADVVAEIKHLRHLKNLDLFGNPLSQEDNYRLLIISEIPWLKTLDRVAITKAELNEALHLKSRLNRMMILKSSAASSDSVDNDGKSSSHDTSSGSQELLNSLLPYIKKIFHSKRVILEEIFLQDDPRKTGMVGTGSFCSVLMQYGIMDILSESELASLADRYQVVSAVPRIGRGKTFCSETIDYRKFCDDFLPQNLRVQNASFQKLETWKMHSVPEISVTASDLRRYVDKNNAAKEEELRKTKREALFAGVCSASESAFSFAAIINDDDRERTISEAWTRYMLHKFILDEINKDGETFESVSIALTANIEFSKLKVLFLFERMANHGKKPTISTEMCMDKIFQSEEVVSLTSLWSFLGPNKESPHRVEWQDLTEEEMEGKETLVFDEANALLDSLLRSSGAGNSEAKSKHSTLLSSTISAATTGTRMAASKTFRKKGRSTTNPHDLIDAAPNRSDVVVIPALKSAAIRAARDEELKKTHDWESEFTALGMRGDALQIALMRKKRSILADEKSQHCDKRSTSKVPLAPVNKEKAGWGSSTGTVVL